MKTIISAVALVTAVTAVVAPSALAQQDATAGVRVKSGYIAVPDGRLYYEEAGQGPTIVFIHDGILHSDVYDAQFTAFAGDHRVVRYDRRGFGRSDYPEKAFSNLDDLKTVFDTLKIDSALLVGCSAGGGLSIDFTLEYPGLVTGLVLVGPVVSGLGYTNHMLTRGGHLTAAIYSDSVRFRNYWFDEDPYEIYPGDSEARARARAFLKAYPQNANFSKDRLDTGPNRPAVRHLNEIKVPTLIVVGDGDIPDVHAHTGAIEAGITGARREIVSNAGHLVALEKPQEVTDLIRSFSLESVFFTTLARDGAPAAVTAYRAMLTRNPEAKPLAEGRLNQLGYQNLQGGKAADALALFKFAVDLYPGSFNVYDSYGEALLASGDTTGAVANYRRSLELNPNNANAVNVLAKLGKK